MFRRIRASLIHLAGSFQRARIDQELIQELENHVELNIDDNVLAGMPPAVARREALMRLGGFQQTLEQCRDIRTAGWLDRLLERRWLPRITRESPSRQRDDD